jgi:hypothetical protein
LGDYREYAYFVLFAKGDAPARRLEWLDATAVRIVSPDVEELRAL